MQMSDQGKTAFYVPDDEIGQFIYEVGKELERARKKFPAQSLWVTLAALTEEIGELNQAFLQYNFEPHKNIGPEQIRKEAIQSCVMIMRALFDCEAK